MASSSSPTPAAAAAPVEHKAKPEQPDEAAYKKSLAEAEQALSVAQKKLDAIKAEINSATPNNQDSPLAKRRQELVAQLNAIRQQQHGFKTSRGAVQDQINSLDANIKARQADQKTQLDRLSLKSADDINAQIERLEKAVDSGTMKLVDEKRYLADISNLRKQSKGIDENKKTIDQLKATLAGLKGNLKNPEADALSQQYTALTKELDEIKSKQDHDYKNINSLRDTRSKIQAEQQKAWTGLREIKDNYYNARRAWRDYNQEAIRIRNERRKAEQDQYHRERKKKIADQKLEEASRPAYTDELLIAEGLIRHFDPSYDISSLGLGNNQKFESDAYRAAIGRTVDDTGIKGVKVLKKDDREESYFVGFAGKKGKKGKKGNAANSAPETGKFNLSAGVIEDLSKVNVEPPMNQSNVPALIEKLVEKVKEWKSGQEAKTAENLKKAQDEIDRLEKEDASSTGTKTPEDTKSPAVVVSEKLEQTSLEA
ncbi:hypothetical protein FQN57_006507 [Myotisia sp. PD_48]|nr:hypothetical protein FQN57_006507 [Myotisia sp. PD_48]